MRATTLPWTWLCFSLVACSGASDPELSRSNAPDEVFTQLVEMREQLVDPGHTFVGRWIPEVSLRTGSGEVLGLSELVGTRGTVVVLANADCAVSMRTLDAVRELEATFVPRGVALVVVHLEGTPELYGVDLFDEGGQLASTLGARTTGEVFVLDAARTLVYQGALRSEFSGEPDADPDASVGTVEGTPFLERALAALFESSPVEIPATSAGGRALSSAAQAPAPRPITYHDQIARIVQANCAECHHDGGAAPFSLESYRDLKGRRGMVRYVVEQGVMPPWFATETHWENDRRLSDEERTSLVTWIEAGCPEGDPARAPLRRTWPRGWLIGEPELVFEFESFDVPAEGVVDLLTRSCETVVQEDLWIRAMQVLPSQPQVVHHATALVKFPEPMEAERNAFQRVRNRSGWEFLMGYIPGKGPRVYETGVGRFLPKGTRLRVDMHYTPDGIAVTDHTRLGIVRNAEPPELESHVRLLRNHDLFIPAGASGVAFEIDHLVRQDLLLRSLTPHMHLIAKTFEVDLIDPDGGSRRVLTIPQWDPNWQFTYLLRERPLVRAGSRILVRATYDNTAENPNNLYPGRDVANGAQIWEEMLILAVEGVRPRQR